MVSTVTKKPTKTAKPAAETLEDLIYARGLSIGELSEACGLSPRALFSLRRGEITRPRIRTITALAKALGVDVARLRAAIAATH